MTYGQLLERLQSLTPEQLKQKVRGTQDGSWEPYTLRLSKTKEEYRLLPGDVAYSPISALKEAVKEGDATQEEVDNAPVLPAGSPWFFVTEV